MAVSNCACLGSAELGALKAPKHACGGDRRLRRLPGAATAFAFDRRRPPRRPVDAANKRVSNAGSINPGTYTSTSREGHDNASPAGETTTDSSSDAGARSRPGTIARGSTSIRPRRSATQPSPRQRRIEHRRVRKNLLDVPSVLPAPPRIGYGPRSQCQSVP
jgi:hypothetical protein